MIKKISIILGYRNREADRVNKCLDSLDKQSHRDFEVLFIDYGSDEHFSNAIKPLVESYPFARYYYNHTTGMPWNRAHALNSGVRLAQNEYILFGDIDLIYSPKVLEALAEKASENTQVYSKVFFLPREKNKLEQVMVGDWQNLPCSAEGGKGGVHLVARKHLEEIRGYDEYYCFWGVEDRDLYGRLDQLGLESVWTDHLLFPVFHQWHPEVSGARKGFFPDRWWENMNMHYQLKIYTPERNDEDWGKLYHTEGRKVFRAREVDFKYRTGGDWFYRGRVAEYLVEKIQLLGPDECLKVFIPSGNKKYKGKAALGNRLLGMLPGNYMLEKNVSQGFVPETDLIYMIWHLIRNEDLIGDYAIQEHDRELIIKLMKK